MKCIELTILSQAPLAIGRQKPGGSVSEAEAYIPGSVIRGAIAGHILRLTDHRHSDLSQNGGQFQALFLDQTAAVFHNAYPAIARLNPQESCWVDDPIRILPATALSSKANGGFKIEGKPDDEQKGGVFDTLIDRYCAEQCDHAYDPSCPNDNGRVEPFSGFYSCTDGSSIEHRYRSHSTTTRFLTRVGINRRRATAQDEVLYSIEVLNESFVRSTKVKYPKWEYFAYRSHVWVQDPDLADALTDYINRHQDTFRLGGGVSRGLGRIRLQAKASPYQSDQARAAVETRIKTFNEALLKRWELWAVMRQGEQTLPKKRTFFTLDLQSDAIFKEHWQRTMIVSPAMLCAAATQTDTTVQLHASFASYGYRAGWNAAQGVMKEMELVTNRGTVFLYSTEQPEAWYSALAEREIWGIGDRTPEGFGQLRVCDEFHTIFRENAV